MITAISYKGNTYEIHPGNIVYVIKTKRLGQHVLGTYKQRITSAPKISKLLKLADQYAL